MNVLKNVTYSKKLEQNGKFYQKLEICKRESNGNSRLEKYNNWNSKLKDEFNRRMDRAKIRLVNYTTVLENILA